MTTLASGAFASFSKWIFAVLLVALVVHRLATWRRPRPAGPTAPVALTRWRLGRLVVLLVAVFVRLSFLVLLATGFVPLWTGREALGGYWLMAHATAAPVFCVTLLLYALMTSEMSVWRLDAAPGGAPQRPLGKMCYWLALAAAPVLILSMVLPMLPWLGTDGQHLMLTVHRTCALLFGVCFIGALYSRMARA